MENSGFLDGLEFYVRLIRLPFVIAFGVAAHLSVWSIATGWERTFLLWTFWLFILATMILEIKQLSDKRRK